MSQEPDVLKDVEALSGDPELASMFVAEALDHLGTIEATLLRLDDEPNDRGLLNDVFRPFHTIKGNAGALGIITVQSTAHKVEELLDRCRSGKHTMGRPEVDVVLRAVDILTAMINDLAERSAGKAGIDLTGERVSLIAAVADILNGTQNPAPVAAPTPVVAAAVVEIAFDIPALTPVADTPVAAEPAKPTVAAPVAAATPPQTVNDAMIGGAAQRNAVHSGIKVDINKLDTLVDTVGELVILQSLIQEAALVQITDPKLLRNLAQLRRITSDLQHSAMALRMVPIRQTFQKMARLMRDLTQRAGKPVELVLSGEDTELDRRIVEDISDPLVHMIRNSVDHGIEEREVRAAAGKREMGQLALRAYHQGGNIVIEIEDDGGGLNRDAILKKAIAQGILTAGDVPGDDEIFKLIFAPGFSTAAKITEISGRGVGMDVVRRNIEALHGRIDIASERGKGTKFTIRLPLTLAILDGLVVRAGEERFVIPTFAVRESLRPTASQIHLVSGEPRLVQVRERVLPLVCLRKLFGLDQVGKPIESSTLVVIEDQHRQVALIVDELIGAQEVVVKPLGASMNVTGIAGGAILGDGKVGLILDADGVMKIATAATAHLEAA
ncbi:MAG: chemotaxis protein CheA [Acidobacteriota bacterium]